KRVGWIGIVWSRRVHRFLCLTCENRAAVVSAYLNNTWLQPDVIRASVISRFQRLADIPRGTKPLKRLGYCRPDEHRVENPVLMRLVGSLTSNRFEHAPDVFGKDFLPGRVWMNAIGQIQRRVACHS